MSETTTDPTVEVAYGTADSQTVISIEWQPSLTARVAVDRSGLLDEHSEIDVEGLVLGVFNKPVPDQHVLRPGDRVEIGRALIRDPREMRWEAVAEGAVVGQKKNG